MSTPRITSLERERQRILWRQAMLSTPKGRELLLDLYRRVKGKEALMGPGSIPPEILASAGIQVE